MALLATDGNLTQRTVEIKYGILLSLEKKLMKTAYTVFQYVRIS